MDLVRSRIARTRRSSGFTLIELLLVVAVILVLASITYGIARGVRNAQARAQAKADLAVISQSLEAYKATYGDYPWTENSDADLNTVNGQRLFDALIGWTRVERVDGETRMSLLSAGEVPDAGPAQFIDPTKIEFEGSNLPTDPSIAPARNNYFVDPWGAPYVYVYGKSNGLANSWRAFGYQLYSLGADGIHDASAVGADGVSADDFRTRNGNADNIYAGE